MNISLDKNYNPTLWNYRLAGASTYIEDETRPSFTFTGFIEGIVDHFIIKKLIHQLRSEIGKINKIIDSPISKPISDMDFEIGIQSHKELIRMLDKFTVVEKIDINKIDNKSAKELHSTLIEFIELLKRLEQKIRVDLWPEENKILLTYDELRELYNSQEFCN